MNRFLTTITLICFSFAANADIYFCTTKAEAYANHPDEYLPDYWVRSYTEERGNGVVIDTDQGLRNLISDFISERLPDAVRGEIEGSSKYYGSCEVNQLYINCSYVDGIAVTTTVIDTSETPYKFVQTIISYGARGGQTSVGTCTKA